MALGTPAYMSPEQATADPHVDHRADIYAVGAMAYELLTGRTPFLGATPQSILAAHVSDQAEPVSKYRDHVSAELDAVVMSRANEAIKQLYGQPTLTRSDLDSVSAEGIGEWAQWQESLEQLA